VRDHHGRRPQLHDDWAFYNLVEPKYAVGEGASIACQNGAVRAISHATI
jgi:hypothetical protein